MVTDTGISKRQSISRLEGHREQAMIQDLLVPLPVILSTPTLLSCNFPLAEPSGWGV